jgi:hypothetical protein
LEHLWDSGYDNAPGNCSTGRFPRNRSDIGTELDVAGNRSWEKQFMNWNEAGPWQELQSMTGTEKETRMEQEVVRNRKWEEQLETGTEQGRDSSETWPEHNETGTEQEVVMNTSWEEQLETGTEQGRVRNKAWGERN